MYGEENFIEFYKKNLKLPPEEFVSFLSALSQPLPRTFRMLREFPNAFKKISSVLYLLERPEPELCDAGFIYMQEVVSSLPVLLANCTADDIVLDMCASPGSKSTQLSHRVKLLISNDVVPQRLNALVTNLKKTPTQRIIVTKHDAAAFPAVRVRCKDGAGYEDLRFSKVFCDVPCTSDGTIRKSKNLAWNSRNGVKLNKVQYSILKRASRLVADDGKIIYSTCSFNPVENEAVVQRFIEENDFEIEGVAEDGQLVFREGLTEWDPFVQKSEINRHLFPSGNAELKKCIRILPHDRDTGGFFIAILRRKKEGGCGLKNDDDFVTTGDGVVGRKKEVGTVYQSTTKHRNLFQETKIEKIGANFGVNNDDVFVTTGNGIVRAVSKLVWEIMESSALNIISVGTKAFETNELFPRISFQYCNIVDCRTIKLESAVFYELIKNEKIAFEGAFIGGCVFECGVYKVPGYTGNGKGILYLSKVLRKAICKIEGI